MALVYETDFVVSVGRSRVRDELKRESSARIAQARRLRSRPSALTVRLHQWWNNARDQTPARPGVRFCSVRPVRDCSPCEGGTPERDLESGGNRFYTAGARWGDTGARPLSLLDGRKVRTPRARTLDNVQAERSDTSTTENKPPMAGAGDFGRVRRLR